MTYDIARDYGAEPAFSHQLSPLKGGRYTKVFHGPEGTDVGDLHCDLEPYMEGDSPRVVNHSGWAPTVEQVKQLESGAHVRLSVWQHPIPPLAVSIEPPVCACHEEAMKWDADCEGYVCAKVNLTGERPKADAVEDAFQAAKRDFTPEEVDAEEER